MISCWTSSAPETLDAGEHSASLPASRAPDERATRAWKRPADEGVPSLGERFRAGDEAAFREVYARYRSIVNAALLARVAPQDAPDLLQEVFLAAWRSAATLRSPRRLGAWLLTIARNRAATHHARDVARTEPLPDEPGGDLAAPSSNASSPTDGDGTEILAALRSLPKAYRETLAMRLVEGMSGPEIARALGRSEGAVRVNLSRGMARLREALRRKGAIAS